MWKSLMLAVLVIAAPGEGSARRRVCVVGTGPAGLTAIKFLAEYSHEFECVAFEKNSDVGGMWIYTDSTTVDEHGLPVHSSAYKYLRVNVPKELLAFPDYPSFGGENVSFVKHSDMLQYLRNYTEYYELRPYIQFNTNVEKILPLPKLKWLIKARDLNTKQLNEVTCDAVMLATGHFVKGSIPKIRGIESFAGRTLHSHLYRRPQDFANETVLVLGASYSGQEIATQVSRYAKKIYLSHRHDRLKTKLLWNIEQVPAAMGADGDKLILNGGRRLKVDVLVYATGFLFDFPFLDESSGIKVVGKQIRYVYKHLINVARPTMAILNVPYPRLAILESHAQSAYFIAVLRGKLKLPSRKAMLKSAALPAGKRNRDAHLVNKEIFLYYNHLASAAGYETLPAWFMAASNENTKRIFADPLHFRQYNLVLHKYGGFEFVRHNQNL
ncbi:flavin-containing monooxygenase 5-like [Phymastichus coffea]|uniref:flavin-containing monooxygenase 5-like n=1 Tax=Phymastichus coffea TaxID=108790 RepID=UPI00273BDA0E|nr:flavin-containing monooxygenase 5-like [Phymastichus coffea]